MTTGFIKSFKEYVDNKNIFSLSAYVSNSRYSFSDNLLNIPKLLLLGKFYMLFVYLHNRVCKCLAPLIK